VICKKLKFKRTRGSCNLFLPVSTIYGL